MKHKTLSTVGITVAITGVIMATFFMLAIPGKTVHAVALAESVPFPHTGPFLVGKTNYDLVDHSRHEIFVADTQAQREILVTVYYPAHPAAGSHPSPFLEGKTLETFVQAYGIPASINSMLHANAYVNAPLARLPLKYPVVIFSPGWGTNPLLYAPTLEDLASHGYVVAAVWHTYSCDFTVFPDGRVAYANKAGSDPDHYPDEQNQQTVIRERVGGVWATDDRFVLNQLTYIPRFANHLDLDYVGVFGHSFGGTVALALRGIDPRFKAVADLDGGLSFGSPTPDARYTTPTMFMYSADPKVTGEELKAAGITRQQYEEALAQYHTIEQRYYEHSDPGYLLRLTNSAHMTYAATEALIAPLLGNQITTNDVGTINGQHAVHIYDSYLIAFFNKHLKHLPEPLLYEPSPWHSDVSFESHQ